MVSTVAGAALGAVAVLFGDVLRVVGHHLFLVPDEQTWSGPRDSIVREVLDPALLEAVYGIGVTRTDAVRHPQLLFHPLTDREGVPA